MSTSIRSEVSDALHDLGAAAKHAASDVKDQVGAAVAVAAQSSRDAAAVAAEKAKDASSTAVDKAKDASSTAVDKAKDASSTAVDKAKDASSTAVDKAKDASSTAVDKAKDASSTAVDKARDAASDRADRARGLTADASATVRSRGRKGRKAARKARANALSSASALLDEATSRGKGALVHGRDVATRRPPKKRRGRTLLKVLAGLALLGGAAAAVRTLRPKQVASTGSSIPPKVRPVPTPSDDAVGGLPTSGEDAASVETTTPTETTET